MFYQIFCEGQEVEILEIFFLEEFVNQGLGQIVFLSQEVVIMILVQILNFLVK